MKLQTFIIIRNVIKSSDSFTDAFTSGNTNYSIRLHDNVWRAMHYKWFDLLDTNCHVLSWYWTQWHSIKLEFEAVM